MRQWFLHPIVFYPLALLFAALVVGASLQPQSWPREPAPVSGELTQGAIVLDGAAFNSPAVGPEQYMTVVRDFWGRARALRIAQRADHHGLTPAEHGVRVLLSPDRAALIANQRVFVDVTYSLSAFNAANGLAVSLQGSGPAQWVGVPIPPQPGTVRFELPAQSDVNAIGLRALSEASDQAYALEISRVRITPQGPAAPAN